MTKKSKGSSDGTAEMRPERCVVSGTHPSCAMLKASVIAPRDIIDGLPEELLQWLHQDVDRESLHQPAPRRASRIDFESIVVDRLFPLRDPRTFARRLRLHCQATATAAGILAELSNVSAKEACVCGWLHDLGIAACIRHADEVAYIADDESFAALWPTILRSSAEHGIRLASRWRLPSAIRHAIRDHASFVTLATPSPTACTMFVAEHIANLLGYDFHEQGPTPMVGRALAAIRLGEREMLATGARTEKIMRHSRLVSLPARIAGGA
jgi:hypothetical protein